ncbi:MAG: N-6 DNA methylase, partial [Bacteroidia bacterium]|nr:N-6 DNA methylase [Bacteroidia bacterium]
FHFTIDENSSVDEDVALDPELLGNVFENLLASYNPETSKSARKNTGTYYTPREIVDFMCEQALLAYLKNKVPQADPEALEGLISDAEGVPPVPEEVRREIVKYVMECRILDPACGSGAFPMGMLHRMVKLLQKTDPDGRFMHKPESANDATRGQNVHNVIQKNADYHRKLFLIENCIYGTDIQPIAIQISKLRFFISLLVDEAIDPALPNMGLQPLPNLDIKFIIADALTPLKDVNVGNFVQEFVNDLKALMHEYFEAGTLENKNRLKEKFRVLKQKLVEMARDFGQEELATQMQEFNPFYADHVHAWFDGFLMFGVNNHAATNPHQGFDLVMGNPPYIQLQNDGGALGKKYEKFHYQTFARSGNIYVLFYEKGINLLKEGGHLCYITSNKWLRAGYGKKLRAYLCRWNPLLLVDLGPGVFKSATVDTNILLVEKRGRKPAGRKKGLQATEPFAMRALQAVKENGKVNLWEQMKTRGVVMEKLGDDAWFIGSSAEQRLKEKIERLGKPLKDWDVNIYYGIKTGLNEAFIISTEKRNEILANCKDEEEIKRTEAIIKPILRGRDIKRYYYEWAGLWIIGLFPTLNIDMNNFHSRKNFLYKYKSALMGRAGDQKWFELQANSFFSDGSNYISWLELTNEPRFSIVEKEYYSLNSLTCLASSKHLKYLCGVLNSKVTFFYFDKICISSGVGTNQWRQAYVEKIPIPCVTQFNKFLIDQVEILVNNIYFAKKQNPQADTTEWEREIDRLVYQLYELTEEEVRIIEGSQ